MIPMETVRDWNCVDERTGEPQSFTPLVEYGLHDLTLTLLSWVRGHNLNYPKDPQALTFGQEAGEGYFAFAFYLHGDIAAKATVGSRTHHLAKVIRFDHDSTKIRVRYLIWRELQDREDLHGNRIIRQLVDMLEIDYSLNAHPGLHNAKRAAVDMYNHFNGMFEFSWYREHLAHEPRINGKQAFNQAPAKRLIQPDSHQTA